MNSNLSAPMHEAVTPKPKIDTVFEGFIKICKIRLSNTRSSHCPHCLDNPQSWTTVAGERTDESFNSCTQKGKNG
jgi:hypothetical protein